MLIDRIIQLSRELITPTVELEVEEAGTVLCDQRQEAVVACPSIVGGTFEIADLWQQTRGDALMQEGFDAIGLRRNDEKEFIMSQYLEGDADIAVINLSEDGRPVGVGMRPRELHAALRIPLRREEGRAYLRLIHFWQFRAFQVQREVADDGRIWSIVNGHNDLRFDDLRFTILRISEAAKEVIVCVDATVAKEGPPAAHLL